MKYLLLLFAPVMAMAHFDAGGGCPLPITIDQVLFFQETPVYLSASYCSETTLVIGTKTIPITNAPTFVESRFDITNTYTATSTRHGSLLQSDACHLDQGANDSQHEPGIVIPGEDGQPDTAVIFNPPTGPLPDITGDLATTTWPYGGSVPSTVTIAPAGDGQDPTVVVLQPTGGEPPVTRPALPNGGGSDGGDGQIVTVPAASVPPSGPTNGRPPSPDLTGQPPGNPPPNPSSESRPPLNPSSTTGGSNPPPIGPPGQGSTNPPGQGSTDPPGQGSTNPPGQGSTNPPGQGSTGPPGQGSTDPPGQGSTNPPGQGSTDPPGQGSTGSSSTNPPGQSTGSASTDPPGQSSETAAEGSSSTNPPGQSSSPTNPPGQSSSSTNPPGQSSSPTNPPGQSSSSTNPPGQSSSSTNPPGQSSSSTNPPGQSSGGSSSTVQSSKDPSSTSTSPTTPGESCVITATPVPECCMNELPEDCKPMWDTNGVALKPIIAACKKNIGKYLTEDMAECWEGEVTKDSRGENIADCLMYELEDCCITELPKACQNLKGKRGSAIIDWADQCRDALGLFVHGIAAPCLDKENVATATRGESIADCLEVAYGMRKGPVTISDPEICPRTTSKA